jgi:dTDP-4-dehydrorhamnose reductase
MHLERWPDAPILVTGASGQLGQELLALLKGLSRLTAVDVMSAPDVLELDLTDRDAVSSLVREIRPAVIINAAAYTAVDRAESERELARAVNADAPALLAELAAQSGCLLIHYSTDYVFDGSSDQPRAEDEPPGPLNVYGQTKWEGEEAVRRSGCTHLIFRTSWVFSRHGHNFVKTMLRLGAERPGLDIVDDQVGAPTSAAMLADKTVHVLAGLDPEDPCGSLADKSGTYHLTCAGEVSWHGFAEEIFRQARQLGWEMVVQDVRGIPTSEYPTPAKRPLNSRLDCSRFCAQFSTSLPTWQDCLQETLQGLAGDRG